MSRHAEHAEEIRAVLLDARKLCADLGIDSGAQRQRNGLLICCPSPGHSERNPSCSVTIGQQGTIRVHCFSCGWKGDALTLVAAVHQLDLKAQFKDVLVAAAQLAGLQRIVDEIQGRAPAADAPRAPPRPRPAPAPETEYPPEVEIRVLWSACRPVTSDSTAAQHLATRKLDAALVTARDLARVLPNDRPLPSWACFRGQSWMQTGHRLLLPVYDSDGERRSVRAWRITDGDTPKRLPPAGHKAAELVLANAAAVTLLRPEIEAAPVRLLICEGEPDFLTHATLTVEPVIGLLSGSWTKAFAERVPHGSEVLIRTHLDRAGDKYAADIIRTLDGYADMYRLKAEVVQHDAAE